MSKEHCIKTRFALLNPTLNERARRLWAATEALTYGYGGITAVSRVTGIATSTIVIGLREVRELEKRPPAEGQRIRRPGGGRKKKETQDPTVEADLDRLVAPSTRGDPMSPLRWTSKSVGKLTSELKEMGHSIAAGTVRRLLRSQGFSLQGLRKTREGTDNPDRDAQFEHINAEVGRQLAAGEPAISVDTKKKELVGDFKNGGREWQPKGEPEEVRVHDFIIPELGKANPYGVYDIGKNDAWVSVGIDHDTAEFAVESIRRWWQTMGSEAYPAATRLLITADGGGSNGSRLRLWKTELQKLADELDFPVAVCHLPPGTSKWNKIEHRLFSFITQNWRGRPLISHQVIVSLIGATTTATGLKVRCALDERLYPAGRKVSDEEMAQLNIARHDFHGEWNYVLHPRSRALD
jgi:Rhodopirellula transposase DDE domain